jgi:hypothetical protein
MASEVAWPRERMAAEIEDYALDIASTRAFRSG